MNGDGRNGPAGTPPQRAPSARRRSSTRSLLSALLLAVLMLAVGGVSHAAVSVSRAELSGDRLRIEGTATPSRTITVDGVAMATSDGSGQFRVERSGFTAPADCTVDVDDGSGTPRTAQLSGCTVSSPPPPPPPPPPPAEVTLSTLTLSQTTVVGGSSVTGTVTLTGAAPSGGFAVSLSSSGTFAAVPPTVSVAAGATSAGFTVTTTTVTDTRTATITATGGGVSRSVTLTVVPQSAEQRGSISLARGCVGPCGGGTVTSVPAGVNCTFTPTTTSGACSNVFFPIGTQVRLEARADASSKFAGWEFEVSCREAPRVTIQAGVAHICRPVFNRR